MSGLKTCPYCACTYALPNDWLKDSCPGCARAENLASALRDIAGQQEHVVGWLRANGIVFNGPLGKDPANWQHVAFSIYTDLCEVDTWARQALDDYEYEGAAAYDGSVGSVHTDARDGEERDLWRENE